MTEEAKGAPDKTWRRHVLVFVSGAVLAFMREGLATGSYDFGGSWWFLGNAAIHYVALLFFSVFVYAAVEKLKCHFYGWAENQPQIDMEDYQFLTAVFVLVGAAVVMFFVLLPDDWGVDETEDYRDF